MFDGADVFLKSSNPAVAQVPAEVVVNANTSTGTFNVCDQAGDRADGGDDHGDLDRHRRDDHADGQAGRPAGGRQGGDQESARCQAKTNGCLLQIEATSTNPNAILSVYNGAGGGLLFT